MKKKIKPILFIFTISLFILSMTACKDKTKAPKTEENKLIVAGNTALSEPAVDKYVDEIDSISLEDMLYIPSLHYSNDVEDLQVRAYIKDSNIVKITERYNYKKQQIFGRRVYYINEKGLVFVRQIQQEPAHDSLAIMHEVISYYKNGHVLKSAERFADYEEDLELSPFAMCSKKIMPFDEVNKIMNREGKYTTNFLGFIKSGYFKFLWIGENDQEGLTTTLLIDLQDEFVAELIKHPEKYKGRHIDVDFEHSTMQGITYQMYRGGQFTK